MTGFRHFVAGWLFLAATVIICSAQSANPAGTAAQVLQLTGQVSVLKDSTPWALQAGSTVEPRQIVITGADGFAVFRVADGSTFEVYPNSRVTFRANPGNWHDLLDLWLGRVKIHIEKLSGGAPNHNRVRTPTAVISVRGTVFDVAVEDGDSTLVSVQEGLVAVEHALLPSKEPKLVAGGEYLRVYRDQPLAKVAPNRDAAVRHGLNAVAEALYRILLRNPTPTPGGGGVGGGPSGPAPLPGDTGNSEPPPPPPAPDF
ncbi:MAG TPA: FecR family protein [Bryobacteraceae bacterium]|nr:FecR family protein [Bryobacteraceae bacterium]